MKKYGRYIPFLLLLIAQQIILFVLYCMQYKGNISHFIVVGVGLVLTDIFIDVTILNLFKWILERVEMEERLAEYYRQGQQKWEYDILIQQHIEDMQTLCQQYEAQIDDVYDLLEKKADCGDHRQAARELLQKLENEIARHRIVKYCEQEVINAVFTVKTDQCKEKDIELLIACKLGESLCIDEIDLCSLVDSLLNIGIGICENLQQTEKKIHMKAEWRSDRLVLKQQIDFLSESLPKKKNGWIKRTWCRELDLIERICEKYRGYMEIKEQETKVIFSVVI